MILIIQDISEQLGTVRNLRKYLTETLTKGMCEEYKMNLEKELKIEKGLLKET